MSSIFDRFSWSHRVLCIFLSAVLVIGLAPQMSWAAEAEQDDAVAESHASQATGDETVVNDELDSLDEACDADNADAEGVISASPSAEVPSVKAAASSKGVKRVSVSYEITPSYDGTGDKIKVIEPAREFVSAPGASFLSDEDYEYVFLDEAAQMLRDAMSAHLDSYTVHVRTFEPYETFGNVVLQRAFDEDDNPYHGDYLALLFEGSSVGTAGSVIDGEYFLDITYTLGYKTTIEQENELDSSVNAVLANLDLDGKSAYEKTRAIYDYICGHVTYDYPHLNDETYRLQYTAYAAQLHGTSVCQGYASLFYVMAKKAGLVVRCVTGTGNGGPHAWNIVKLDDGLFYDLDSTWDSSVSGRYKYFLKCDSEFGNHQRGIGSGNKTDYSSAAFYEKHPMSSSSYVLTEDAAFAANSLTVDARIGVNFYVDMSQDLVDAGNVYMTFSREGSAPVRVDFDAEEYGNLGELKVYRFSYGVAAKEIKDNIVAELHKADGAVLCTREYTAAQYGEYVMANPGKFDDDVEQLVKDMLNYGARSQLYFDYNVDNLANTCLKAEDKNLADVDASALKGREVPVRNDEYGLSYYGSSLVLNSNIDIRHYFVLEDGADIDDFEFHTTRGNDLLKPKKSGDMYYVELTDVPPFYLYSNYQVYVTTFNDSWAADIRYGIQSYVKSALTNPVLSSDEKLVDVAKALYWYGVSTRKVFVANA